MTVFVDTSAVYALCDPDDAQRSAARHYVATALSAAEHVTHRYVEVETIALVHARLGVSRVRTLIDGILPGIDVRPVDDAMHGAGLAALMASESRKVSFVDRVSFEFMRRHGLTTAFAFDDDFGRAGFHTVP